MEDYNKQPVYPQDHLGGLQAGIFSTSSCAFLHNPGSPRLRKVTSNDSYPEGLDATKGDSERTPWGIRTGVLFTHISCEETVGKIQAHPEPEDSKQDYQVQEVQDGHNILSEESPDPGMFYGFHRPERCILACTSSVNISETPKVCDKTGGIYPSSPVQSSPFRAVIFSEDFYKSPGGGLGPTQSRGGISPALSGRSTNFCQNKGPVSERSGKDNETPGRSRMDNQRGEIKLDSISDHTILGLHDRFHPGENFSPRREEGEASGGSEEDADKYANLHKSSYVGLRATHCDYSSGAVGTSTWKGAPADNFNELVLWRVPRKINKDTCAGSEEALVVEKSLKPEQGSALEFSFAEKINNRRKFLGLGRPPGRADGSGELDRLGSQKVLQLERAEGYSLGSMGLRKNSPGPSCSGPIGQCHSGGLYIKAGRNKEQGSAILGTPDSSLGRRQAKLHNSDTSEGRFKPYGRLSEQRKSTGSRMESKCRDFSTTNRKMGNAPNRSFRIPKECKSRGLLLTEQAGSGRGIGCISAAMEIPVVLRLSPLSDDPLGLKKATEREHDYDSGGSFLAQTGLVRNNTGDGGGTLLGASASEGPPNAGPPSSPKYPASQVDRLVTEEQMLKNKGLSDKLVSTLLNSRKEVTRAIYFKTWKRFNSWCAIRILSPQEIASVLEFLHEGMEMGLAASTLKVQVAALSVFLERQLSREPLIIRFFKALARARPIPFKFFPRWDLSVVLRGLIKGPFEPPEEASIRLWSLKIVLLVAVTSARRVSELQALSIREPFCYIFPDRVVLKTDPGFLPKVASAFHREQEIILPTFCPNPSSAKERSFHSLDVRRCLLHYIEITKDFRRSDSLFVLFSGPRKGYRASKSTIGRWLRMAISEAYKASGAEPPKGVVAHSTRAVATSWAERAGASPGRICKAATWTSFSTFTRHYRLDLLSAAEQSFGRKVLQAVVPP